MWRKEMHCSGEADRKENLCQTSKIATTPSAPASEVKNTWKSAEPSWYLLSLPPEQIQDDVDGGFARIEVACVPMSVRNTMGCRRWL